MNAYVIPPLSHLETDSQVVLYLPKENSDAIRVGSARLYDYFEV